jgi:hypothetical protein
MDAVIAKLCSVNGIVNVCSVGVSERTAILSIEEEACAVSDSRSLEFANEGAKMVLGCTSVVAANHTSSLRHPAKPLFVLMLGECEVGQEVWEQEQVASFRANSNAILIGDGLVIFRDKLKAARGKKLRVVFGPQSFPEVESVDGVRGALSATVSRATDTYIKKMAGWHLNSSDRGTLLIGFSCP